MKVVTKYSPLRDRKAVDQTGYVDLASANAESSIPVDVPLAEERFNRIEDPRAIGSRPGDVFEAAQAHKAISDYKAPDDDSVKE